MMMKRVEARVAFAKRGGYYLCQHTYCRATYSAFILVKIERKSQLISIDLIASLFLKYVFSPVFLFEGNKRHLQKYF